MMQRSTEAWSSIRKTVLFWWILFVVLQTAERVFLLRDAFAQETPTLALLLKTLVVGVRGDFITATLVLVLAAIGAAGWALLRQGWTRLRGPARLFALSFRRALHVSCFLFGVLLSSSCRSTWDITASIGNIWISCFSNMSGICSHLRRPRRRPTCRR